MKQNKLLNFVLILLLMLAPLRSVFAMQFMACDMKLVSSQVAAQVAVQGAPSTDHCQHVTAPAAGAVSVTKSVRSDYRSDLAEGLATQMVSHQTKSCCSDNGACMSDCHFAISASLFIQRADYSPLLHTTDVFENVSNTLLNRELSPLSKPPLPLYS